MTIFDWLIHIGLGIVGGIVAGVINFLVALSIERLKED